MCNSPAEGSTTLSVTKCNIGKCNVKDKDSGQWTNRSRWQHFKAWQVKSNIDGGSASSASLPCQRALCVVSLKPDRIISPSCKLWFGNDPLLALFFSKNNKTRMIFSIPNWKTSLFGYLYLQFSTLSSEWAMLPPLLKINLLWYIPLKQLLRQRYGELHSSEVNEIVILICLKHGDSSHKCISWTQQMYPLFFLQIK